MNEQEWLTSNDASAMIGFLWQSYDEGRDDSPLSKLSLCFGGNVGELTFPQSRTDLLQQRLHKYYLGCCRMIWKLLPQDESRKGVELAEQYLAGKVTGDELSNYNWHVEGAAFRIDYNTEPERIRIWEEEVRALPKSELEAILNPAELASKLEPRELLKRAAYFADFAMIYPSLRPLGLPPESYHAFLSAILLREIVGNPFRGLGGAFPLDRKQ